MRKLGELKISPQPNGPGGAHGGRRAPISACNRPAAAPPHAATVWSTSPTRLGAIPPRPVAERPHLDRRVPAIPSLRGEAAASRGQPVPRRTGGWVPRFRRTPGTRGRLKAAAGELCRPRTPRWFLTARCTGAKRRPSRSSSAGAVPSAPSIRWARPQAWRRRIRPNRTTPGIGHSTPHRSGTGLQGAGRRFSSTGASRMRHRILPAPT